uniref:Uncharacterized protein n=1 Tax=Solanum tuberosum TaxID=4113 RepID=M1DH50_SOLTU
MEFEALYKKKQRYIPPYERRKPKDYEDGQVEEILSPILHKVKNHDRVLKEIKENVGEPRVQLATHRRGRRARLGPPLDSRNYAVNTEEVGDPDLARRWTQEIMQLKSVKLGGPMDKSANPTLFVVWTLTLTGGLVKLGEVRNHLACH